MKTRSIFLTVTAAMSFFAASCGRTESALNDEPAKNVGHLIIMNYSPEDMLEQLDKLCNGRCRGTEKKEGQHRVIAQPKGKEGWLYRTPPIDIASGNILSAELTYNVDSMVRSLRVIGKNCGNAKTAEAQGCVFGNYHYKARDGNLYILSHYELLPILNYDVLLIAKRKGKRVVLAKQNYEHKLGFHRSIRVSAGEFYKGEKSLMWQKFSPDENQGELTNVQFEIYVHRTQDIRGMLPYGWPQIKERPYLYDMLGLDGSKKAEWDNELWDFDFIEATIKFLGK